MRRADTATAPFTPLRRSAYSRMGAGPRPLEVPLSEVIGALSYALDLTEGEPPGHAARSCMIGMRLADELGLDAAGPLGPLLRAAAQGRGLLGERGADGGAVRGRRPSGQAQLEAGRLGATLPAFVWAAADGRRPAVARGRAPCACWRCATKARSPAR